MSDALPPEENTPGLWASLRDKLVERIGFLLEATLDHDRGTTIRDEAKEFTSALLDYAKAKLAMPGLEAEKVAAEISRTFAEKQTELAKAEKLSEEARQLRIQNDLTELRLALATTKVMLVGDKTEEAALFGQQLDAFLDALNLISGDPGYESRYLISGRRQGAL